MAASNRAARLTKLVTDLKKRYKPTATAEKPLFETLIYATLVENSTTDAADKAMSGLEKAYFDWNEVRVSSRVELAERLKPLNDPKKASDRLKRTLQSVFETIYAFDMESFKKQNLGEAVKQIEAYDGVTPFVVAYVTQHGLAGHAIAINEGGLLALEVMEIITGAEAKKHTVPGLERAVPKNKGVEAQAVLHEMGVEVGKNPYGTAARKLLTDLDPSCKDRLPKRPVKKEAPQAAKTKENTEKESKKDSKPSNKSAKKPATSKKGDSAKSTAKKKSADSKSKSTSAGKSEPTKKPATKKKSTTKKAAPKKVATKKGAKKESAKAKKAPVKKKAPTKKATKKAAKRKPK